MNILIVKNISGSEFKKYEDLLYRLRTSYIIARSKEAALNLLKNQIVDDMEDEKRIEGIILDPSIPEYDNGRNYDQKMGLGIISYLEENNMNIPVIINSELVLKDYEKEYPYIYGQFGKQYNPKILEQFLEYIFSLE